MAERDLIAMVLPATIAAGCSADRTITAADRATTIAADRATAAAIPATVLVDREHSDG